MIKRITVLLYAITFAGCTLTNSDRMKEVKRDNAVIDYRIEGTGDTTLLFVHGSYMDQTCWNAQVNYFSKRYKVVTFDLPGHGKSGKERGEWSMYGFSEDVLTVINELELKNVILIGHSMAADINLMATISDPDEIIGFIAIDIFKNAATPLPPAYEKQSVQIVKQLKTDFANTNEQYARMALLTKQTPSEITDRVISAYRNANQPMGIIITPEIFTMYRTEKKLLPLLKLKLHLINVDYIPTNEEPLKKYAGGGYEVLHMNGTSHYPMLEHPEELNKLLQQIIFEILK